MFSIASKSRVAVGFFLFLALVLTVFLLSGVTQSSPAVRNVYLLKLHYTVQNRGDATSGGNSVIPSSRIPGNPTPTVTVTDIPSATLSLEINDVNSTGNTQTTTKDNQNTVPTTSTYSWKIPRPTPTTTQKVSTTDLSIHTLSPATLRLTQRSPSEGTHTPGGINRLEHRLRNYNSGNAYNDTLVHSRQYSATDDKVLEIISLKNVSLEVFFGYYGICVSLPTLPVRCAKKRPRSATELKLSLFPGEYNPDGTVNSTSLTLDKDPQDILDLALHLQRVITPFPVVCAVVAFGIAWACSVYIWFSSGTGYSGVGGEKHVRLDKVTFGFAMAGFLCLLTAVSWLKVAGDIAWEVLTGEGPGGVDGFLLETAGVEATPGYQAVRIGVGALVIGGGVVGGMAWCLGVGGSLERGGEGGWMGRVGRIWGRGRGKGRGGEYGDVVEGPQRKWNIGKPTPVVLEGYPVQVHPQQKQHIHPAFAGERTPAGYV